MKQLPIRKNFKHVVTDSSPQQLIIDFSKHCAVGQLFSLFIGAIFINIPVLFLSCLMLALFVTWPLGAHSFI